MLLMGMAVGVDYSLFYLKREREERAAGHGEEALPRAAATSGQAVLISGGTVLIAMAGMLLAGSKIFTSIGIGTMIVVFTSIVGSLTVLPALLGKLDNRVERGVLAVGAAGVLRALRGANARPAWLVRLRERQTLLRRLKGDRTESRVWGAVLRPVLRFPAIAAALAVALLVLLALPVRGIHTKLLSFTDLPRSIPIVKTYIAIQKAFPGAQTPAQVVVQAPDVTSPGVQQGIAQAGAARPRDRPDVPADRAVREPGAHRRAHPGSAGRERRQQHVDRGAARAAHRRAAADDRPREQRELCGDRRDRRYADFNNTMGRTSRSCSRSCSGSRSCSC